MMSRSGLRYLRRVLSCWLKASSFRKSEVQDQVENGPVKHVKVHLDGSVAKGLSQVGFAHARRADKQDVGGLTHELAGGQFKDLFAVDGGIELPVELVEGFEVPEAGGLGAARQHSLLSHIQLILED